MKRFPLLTSGMPYSPLLCSFPCGAGRCDHLVKTTTATGPPFSRALAGLPPEQPVSISSVSLPRQPTNAHELFLMGRSMQTAQCT